MTKSILRTSQYSNREMVLAESRAKVFAMSLIEFLELIRDIDFKLRSRVLEDKGKNCDGIKGRMDCLDHHIKLLKRKK